MSGAPVRIDQIFTRAAARRPDALHLILPDGAAASYAETVDRARRLAGVLAAGGVGAGDRVAALLPNSRELYEFYVACALAGAVAVPVNTQSTARECGALFADCAPAALVADARLLGRVPESARPAAMGLLVAAGGGGAEGWLGYDAALAEAEPAAPRGRGGGGEPAMMIYSSGTTGAPKGILLGHRALVENARMTLGVLGYGGDDRFLTLLPSFSSFGFSFDFAQAGLAGAATVILEAFEAEAALALIERHRVTCIAGVPTMLAGMFDPAVMVGRDLASLRLVDVGGGPVSRRLVEDLRGRLGVETVESYGLTEISPVASVQAPGRVQKTGSCGRPLPGIEVRVVDADGKDVAPGAPGELLFRCQTFMAGYWNQPELTRKTLAGGWLHSGDVGRVDEDGDIYILDRVKDVIVSSGYNVYPKEVENVICELRDVQSAAVVGVGDEVRGEVVHAYVVLNAGGRLGEDEVLAHCRANLARFKMPRRVAFVDALPLTASGKIRRFQLRRAAEG